MGEDRTILTVKVNLDFYGSVEYTAVRKFYVALDENEEIVNMRKWYLSHGGEWVDVAEGEAVPEQCLFRRVSKSDECATELFDVYASRTVVFERIPTLGDL